MNGWWAALATESLKMRKSKMFLITMLTFAFIGAMMGFLMYIAQHPEIAGRSATMSTKASMVGSVDWPSFLNLLVQSILALGAIGFGMVASWVFGREYADRTIKDLLALPVSRTTMVTAKFAVTAWWSVMLALTLFVVGLLTGLAIHLPGWSAGTVAHMLGVFLGSALLTLVLCTVVAWIACISRGYLPAVGFAILTLILTNFVAIALPNILPYFPWGIPALYSGIAGREPLPQPGMASYLVLAATGILGFAGTVLWWRFADQT